MIRGIANAELIVADVTGLNPNVLYELGLAHAMGKRCVMLTQKIADLPYDLRPYRANEYSTRFNAAHEIAATVKSIGEAALTGDTLFSNPVQDFAPNSLMVNSQVNPVQGGDGRASAGTSASGATADGSDQEDDLPPGLLDSKDQLERSSEATIDVLGRIGNAT